MGKGDARTAILARLKAVGVPGNLPARDDAVLAARSWPPRERLGRLRACMEAVHAEFLEAASGDWPRVLLAFGRKEGLRNLLFGPRGPEAGALTSAWTLGDPELIPYDRALETFKDALFHQVDAGFTSTLAGVAETGGLLLEPGPSEPRLLSLVPPMHLALLRASTIEDTLWSAMRNRGWGQGAARHALLISGPSKTADIEQTLAYGVHGPRRLVVVLVDDLGP